MSKLIWNWEWEKPIRNFTWNSINTSKKSLLRLYYRSNYSTVRMMFLQPKYWYWNHFYLVGVMMFISKKGCQIVAPDSFYPPMSQTAQKSLASSIVFSCSIIDLIVQNIVYSDCLGYIHFSWKTVNSWRHVKLEFIWQNY